MISFLSVVLAGLTLGVKHALDADHLAAVATIASESKSSWRAATVGALWGVGHTLALAAAGVVVLVFGITLPAWLTWWAELAVAASLVWLGAAALYPLARGYAVHSHWHRHGWRWHVHPHAHARHARDRAPGSHHGARDVRPFAFGLLHGLAGSAGLFFVVLSSQPNSALAWCYLAAFGFGSTAGMTAFSVLLTVPARGQRTHAGSLPARLRALAGAASVVVGLGLGYELLLA